MSVASVLEAIESAASQLGRIPRCEHLLEDLEAGQALGRLCAHHPSQLMCPPCGARHLDERHPRRLCLACRRSGEVWEYPATTDPIKVGEAWLTVTISGGELCGSCHEKIVEVVR